VSIKVCNLNHQSWLSRAFVTLGDIDEEEVKAVVAKLGVEKAIAVQCDVRAWKDQLTLFETAMSSSPNKSVDIVIANAGLGGAGDAMMVEDGEGLFLFYQTTTRRSCWPQV
jgi:NAD(P)-dependent dehydrogenase (short-subunit alcohol dehydrogenase family)